MSWSGRSILCSQGGTDGDFFTLPWSFTFPLHEQDRDRASTCINGILFTNAVTSPQLLIHLDVCVWSLLDLIDRGSHLPQNPGCSAINRIEPNVDETEDRARTKRIKTLSPSPSKKKRNIPSQCFIQILNRLQCSWHVLTSICDPTCRHSAEAPDKLPQENNRPKVMAEYGRVMKKSETWRWNN